MAHLRRGHGRSGPPFKYGFSLTTRADLAAACDHYPPALIRLSNAHNKQIWAASVLDRPRDDVRADRRHCARSPGPS
jgi:hypothetical protein